MALLETRLLLDGVSPRLCNDFIPMMRARTKSHTVATGLLLSTRMNRSSPLRRNFCTIRALAIASGASISNKKKVIVISGPTGAGKSRLAMEVAERLGGEIISADSVQVYRGLDVGSAKPSASEQRKVPHHLIDILHPSEDYSVGKFFEDARRATDDVLQRGRVPIVAGGTGLYLRWYIYGKPEVPTASQDVSKEVWSELAELQRSRKWEEGVELVVNAGDPRAREFPTNNWYRLRRSLEILKATAAPPSAFPLPYDEFNERIRSRSVASHGEVAEELVSVEDLDYDFLCFFLTSPRMHLYRSIDLRCEEMLMDTGGLLTEATWLLNIGLLPGMNSATRAIGYRQAMEFLLSCRQNGCRSSPGELFDLLQEFQKASRNFAKRQITWFRNDRLYRWVDASQPFDDIVKFICDAYRQGKDRKTVPASLRINSRESIGREEMREMKSYSSRNKLFRREEDCYPILDFLSAASRLVSEISHRPTSTQVNDSLL